MSPRLRRRAPESGSAYIVALLALVVLTILGMGLALITQTEMQVGANERVVQRVFYAADSGLADATSRLLVSNDPDPKLLDLPDADSGLLAPVTQQVDISGTLPIMDAPCNLCQINSCSQYGSNCYAKINYGITTTATRDLPGNPEAKASKTISTLMECQPCTDSVEAVALLQKPEIAAKLKF